MFFKQALEQTIFNQYYSVNVEKCQQSSRKTRELRREIMQSMVLLHSEACYWSRREQ